MFYWIAYYIVKTISLIFFPAKVSGLENVPRQGSCIFASNHISNIDPFVVGLAVHRRISYVAKEELFQNKIQAFLLRHVEAFPIKRESSDIRSVRESMRRLKRGCALLIFPQGTRSKGEGESTVHKGIGFLAAKSGLPVIPVYISDSDKVLPRGASFLKRHWIKIKFGKPLVFSPQDAYADISQRIMNEIHALQTPSS